MTPPTDPTSPHRPAGWIRAALHLPALLYRWHLGWLLGRRFLLLAHVGRNTGRTYQTVLEVIGRSGAGELTVMSGWGRRSDWYRNIQHRPTVQISVGHHTITMTHHCVPTDQAVDIVAAYERRNRLAGPVVRQVLSSLLGWRYDGTTTSRQRLARQIP